VTEGACGPPSVVFRSFAGGRPAQPLLLRPAALVGQASLAGGGAGARRTPLATRAERGRERGGEPLEGELAVSRLAPLVLGDRADHRAETLEQAPALRIGQRGGCRHVEDGLHARLRLLRVLAAGAARARGAKLDLREREDEVRGHLQRLGHGVILPRL